MEIQTLVVGLVCVLIFYLVKRPRVGANEPPFVPYTIPIIGHTYQYLFNSKEFIRNCKEKYGECFSIYVYGKVITVISRNLINDLHKDSQVFDLQEAVSEVLPLHRIFVYNGGLDKENIRFHVKTTREQVSGKLDTNIPIAQKYLLKRIEKWIGDCSEPKTLNSIWFMINDIVALPITNILVGEEAASHEDLVESLRDLAFDLGKLTMIPPIFSFIHKDLHEFIISLPMRFGWNPISRHRKVLMDRIKPVIEKRVEEKKVLGDNYKPYNDLLEYYMNQPDFDHTDLNKLLYYTDNFFAIDFAAITTTSGAATHALFDLAGRPEYVNELYEEALAIDKECNGSPTPAHIKNMVKLDSFLKESLRLSRDTVSTGHCLISKGYTFSNGSTIPKGRKVTMYIDDSLKSKEAFGNDAEDFKPFRFVNGNSPATKVDRSYVVFGGGKHACPGRFFAVNEIKLVLHKLILRYEISTKSGKVEEKLILGSNILPPQGALVFKNRK